MLEAVATETFGMEVLGLGCADCALLLHLWLEDAIVLHSAAGNVLQPVL
jgi:hypothetical protein